MTDIEEKVVVLISDVRREYPNLADYLAARLALSRAIEQHEAFKQEVSDKLEVCRGTRVGNEIWPSWADMLLERFIIPTPKPDPLVEAVRETFTTYADQRDADKLRAALEARGLEIREKGQ